MLAIDFPILDHFIIEGRMHDTLNFFDPKPDIPAHHENQLTRAFLVVLRMCPAAHQVWLSRVAPGLKLSELLGPRTFDTQRRQMYEQVPEVAEWIRGISVLQAADLDSGAESVHVDERVQVLDGIVRYGDELLIVMETKLEGRVPSRQARLLNIHGARVRFDRRVSPVSWRDLLNAWSDLLERNVLNPTERMLLQDFLDFVESYFPRIGPFTTLARCKDHEFRISKRLKASLDEIAGEQTHGWLDLSGRSVIDRAYLEFSGQSIILKMYPADTLSQAKAFYTNPRCISGVFELRDKGWKIRPNFHFGYMAKGLVWTTPAVRVEKYLDYWAKHIEQTKPIARSAWNRFWRELVHRGFATNADKRRFDSKFTRTARNSAIPRPGLGCFYVWDLLEARALDEENKFTKDVADKINALLRAVDEQRVDVRRRTSQ